MEYRQLGGSGLKVSALSFGTATFGGGGAFFSAWGNTDVAEARRMVDICLEAGVTLFDTADTYSRGVSEEVLGKAISGRRDSAWNARSQRCWQPSFHIGSSDSVALLPCWSCLPTIHAQQFKPSEAHSSASCSPRS